MTGADEERDEVEVEVDRGRERVPGERRAGGGYEEADPPERRLADELGRVHVATTAEGYVEGRVIDLRSVDETTVRLEVALPHDEVVAFALEKPIPWSEAFLLARIVEDVGYDASSIGHLVGERVLLARTDAGANADEPTGWLASALETAGDRLLASATDGRYRLSADRAPGWRLVDPRERPDPADDDSGLAATAAAALVLLGVVAAAVGAAAGAAGGFVVSGAVVGYALPGLALALAGLYVLVRTAATDRQGA
ncbi:hypothetical protein [Salinilacihabitans rarus]|uniref:hypothetical protein n=1 Tax=Salinilacihabitans rarus TaxID=2961596 RepID=UPI0020C84829|nr:hypothetical protein [Salinilacihabitans rarus]